MIPFYVPPKLTDLQIICIKTEIEKALQKGQITNGENVRQLEQQVKELHDVETVVACSSATQAMSVVLNALKIKSLTVQAFTWQSLQFILPARTRFCDVNAETWLMNQAEGDKIVTHTFGNTHKMESESKTIYDGAYSLGAFLPDIGDATVISMTATKPVTACEGGLILTNNNKLGRKAREVRDKCSRMSEVNAIVGIMYLQMLDKVLSKRKRVFEYYNAHLPFKTQKTSKWGTNYGFYGCLVPDRDRLIERLKDKVELRVRYEPLLKGFENTDEVARNIVILPCYPDLEPSVVVSQINEVTKDGC